MDDQDDAQVKRWERKRRNREKAVKEIVSSEKTYIGILEFIINEYEKPLSQGRPRLIPNEQVAILFPAILSNILTLNNKLLHDLESKVLANYDNESTPLAYLFKEFVPFFKMYTNYVNNHEKAVTELRHLNDNEKFQKYCNEKRSICNGLDLQSLLIQPIQRIPRYEILIREVLSNTHHTHPDKEELESCYDEIKKMNSKIDHAMDEHKRREAVRIVEEQLGGSAAIGFDLVGPARRLVKKGKFFKMSRAKNIEYTFFLFSDMLLYCSDRGNDQFKLHKMLPINDAFSITDVSEAEQKNGFILYNSVKSFKAFASSPQEKRDWFDALEGCVREYRIRRPQLPKRPGADEQHVAAIWDADGKECVLCTKKFGFVTRRHHCRRCGRLVCHDCSKWRLPSLMKKKTTVYERACKICFKDYNDQGGDSNSKAKVVDGDAASVLLGSEKMGGPDQDEVPSDTSSCERCKAMYDYEAEYENDLSFKTDDIILILEQNGDWWRGVHEDKSKGKKSGLFPSNYVEVIQGPKEGDIYVAICNYNAESKEELTLRQGERYVLNVVDASGWWLVSSEANKSERGWTSPQLVQKASEYQEPEEEEVVQSSNNFANAGEIDPIITSEPVIPDPTPSPQQTAIDPRLKNLVAAETTTSKRKSGLPRPSVKQKAKASPPPTPVVEKKHSAKSKFQKRAGPKTFSLGATQSNEKAPAMAPPPPPSGVVKKQSSVGPKSPKPKPIVAPLEDMNSGVDDSGKNYCTYQELTSMKLRGEFRDGIDSKNLETYLCDEEFEEIFGMTRAKYDGLAKWKKKQHKQKAKLW